jgi:hypothetical protein
MNEFNVQTGNFKITVVAESAIDAAMEAVQIWEALQPGSQPGQVDAAHRANLDPLTVVRPADRRGVERRFPTFNLLAYSHRESPSQAWERVLSGRISVN